MRRPAFACKITRPLADFIEQGALSKTELRVLFLLSSAMNGHNVVTASLNKLLRGSGIERKTAYRALKGLITKDFVRRHPMGYQIDPSLMWRGGDRQWDLAIKEWSTNEPDSR